MVFGLCPTSLTVMSLIFSLSQQCLVCLHIKQQLLSKFTETMKILDQCSQRRIRSHMTTENSHPSHVKILHGTFKEEEREFDHQKCNIEEHEEQSLRHESSMP